MLNGIESKSGLAGYMPLKSQYGFIYSGNIDALTIAHELGHGAFRLWHTFSTESDYFMPQNSSDNLMDYPDSYRDGKRLHKYQWDYIHNPEGGLYLFQEEEEAAMELQCEDVLKARLVEIKESNSKEESSIKMNWSNDDFDCSLFDVKIGETTFEQIGFIAPFSDYGGEFNFNPSEYIKTELDEFDEVKKDFIRYDFGDFEIEDNQMVMLSVAVLEEQADEMEEYLFGKIGPLKHNEYRGYSSGQWKPNSATYGCTREDELYDCNDDNIMGDKPHHGVDLKASIGDECYSIAKGTVTHVQEVTDYGTCVAILCNLKNNSTGQKEQLYIFYAHLSETNVVVGQEIEKGTVIGKVGISGATWLQNYPDEIHLHFEIFDKWWPSGFEDRRNPSDYIEINEAK